MEDEPNCVILHELFELPLFISIARIYLLEKFLLELCRKASNIMELISFFLYPKMEKKNKELEEEVRFTDVIPLI